VKAGKEDLNWRTTTIAKSAYLKGRIGWQGLKASEFLEEGPFLVTGTDFAGGRIDWDRCYHVSESRYAEAGYIHLKNDDVLITKDGTIGKIAFVEDCPAKAVLNSGIFLLRCNDGSFDHRYISHILKSNAFRKFLDDNLAGSTIQHLYQHVFKTFEFPIPDVCEQTTISEILLTVDRAIEQTEALISKQKRIKAGLMQDLLTRGIDENGTVRSKKTHKFKNSSLGDIPAEWVVVEIKRVCSLITKGTTPKNRSTESASHSIPYLRVQNITSSGQLDWLDLAFISPATHKGELARSRVLAGDVLQNIVGPPLGKIAIVPRDYPEWNINQAIAVFRPNARVSSEFLYYWLQFPATRAWFDINSKKTSGQQNLTLEHCQRAPIALPPVEEQSRICTSLGQSVEVQRRGVRHLQKLFLLRTALTQDLLTGRKRVTALLKSRPKREKIYVG
jgi:type I restriction enzyme S subunit